jgi:hypothetical protein
MESGLSVFIIFALVGVRNVCAASVQLASELNQNPLLFLLKRSHADLLEVNP